ncbi:MAG: shikimate dehydrogenase [Endomicrobiales bacterium]
MRLVGIFGFPVRHSLSPAMHNAAFSALGMDFTYVPFEVPPEKLRPAVEALRTLHFAGVNTTIPHKEKVMRFLDAVDPEAARIGSVNTLVNRNGKLWGYNTDGKGFLADLREHGFSPRGKTALMVGAGGAARAMAWALSRAGIKKLYICDQDGRRARALAGKTARAQAVPAATWKHAVPGIDILINATPVGMRPGDPPLARAPELKRGIFVYDVVYNRSTELLAEARKAGAIPCSGFGMLLHQGALAFQLWTGKKAPLEVMRKALLKAMKH